MSWTESEKIELMKRYQSRLSTEGVSPQTLGWDKGKQNLRFSALCQVITTSEPVILDIGCGFGDLNYYLRDSFGNAYTYIGIDVVPEFIEISRKAWTTANISFFVSDFVGSSLRNYDYAIGSGLFNHQMSESSMDNFRSGVMRKAYSGAAQGIAFDFLSSNVDWTLDHTFHHDPSAVLTEVMKLSRRVTLYNDYMPFEFAVLVSKDDTFSKMTRFNEPQRTPPLREWGYDKY